MTKLPVPANLVDQRRRLRRKRGFSLIELLIVIAIILVIMAIAVPNYNKYQMASRETAVLKELETIYTAQTLYYSSYGKYAANLTDLGPPTGGAEGPQGANMLPKVLADGLHNSYRYTMAGSGSTFSVTAVPETFGSSGRRSFFMDQTKTVHESRTAEPASANSPEVH